EEEEAKKKKAEEEAKKKKAEEEAKKKQEEEEAKKKKAEEEAKKKKKAEEEAKKKQEEEEAKKKKAEEEAKEKKVEEEAKKKQEEEEAKKKKAEEEAKKKKAEEEAKKKKAEEEAKTKQEEEEAKKKKAEEEVKKKQEEEEAKKKKAEVEAKKKKAEEEAKKKQEEEEAKKKKKAEEEAKKKKAEEEAKKQTEIENMSTKMVESVAKKHQEQEVKQEQEEVRTTKKKEKRTLRTKIEEEEMKNVMVEIKKEGPQRGKEEDKLRYEAESSSTLSEGIAHSDAFNNRNAKLLIKIQTLFDNFHQMLLEVKRMFLTNNAGKNLSAELKHVKHSIMSSEELEFCEVEIPLMKLFHTTIVTFIDSLSRVDLYSEQPETWKALEDGVLQVLESFVQLQQRSEHLQGTEWRTVYTLYKTIMVILTDTRQCIYQRRSTQAETELALSKTSVELQLLQKDLEYIRLNAIDRADVASKTVESYFALACKTLTLLHPCVEATMKKPSYSTCANILLQLTIPVHDLVKDLPTGTSWTVECVTPALKHNLRQLYRVVSLMSQQHITRIRNEREVSLVEEIRRHLLSLDRVLKALLDLHSKVEMQRELLDTIRRNLITLKSVMMQVRTDYCLQSLVEKDDQLLSAFEMVVEKLTINPLQLDSVEYLRLLAESLEKYCDIMRRLSNNVTISDWLLRYQLQLLKIFDTIEFCLSEEQFIVIGSKEKYTRTSTQDAIHTVKQMITHYKITSSQQQQVRREQASEPTHIKVIAARQGLTDTSEPVARSVQERSPRRTADVRQQRSDTVRRQATRSPLGMRDDPPRSSSRCSLGALPSKRGPSFAVYLKNVFIERDHSFKLLCVVLDSEIDVRWTKDGSDITQTGRYRMVQKNGLITLQVDHAEYEDTGVYACHVFNNYGQSFNKCTVEVYDTSDDIICSSFSIPHKMVADLFNDGPLPHDNISDVRRTNSSRCDGY
uniref:Ig-like domain-containing protein n=1 Tax=Anopheles culicifacies TaxID=139723 RepID=A0A182MIQ5_9DIPT